jgi:hypothetical protein
MFVGSLAGCISGRPSSDTYTDKSGKTSVVESDREQCERSCNDSYSRCMETTDARSNSGIKGPSGMFGASSECRNDLTACLPRCKAR